MALENELKFYESKKSELLQHHEGKFALIIGENLLGTFDTAEEAYRVGVEKYGNVPMLIKQILQQEPVVSIPILTLGISGASL